MQGMSSMRKCFLPVGIALLLAQSVLSQALGGEAQFQPATRLRRPVAMTLSRDGRLLFAANRRSGTVSTIDTQAREVIAEQRIGRQLSDIERTPDGRFLLALDEAANELIVLSPQDVLQSAIRLPVSSAPVSLSVTSDGQACFVASLWSRRLTKVHLAPLYADGEPQPPRVLAVLDLSFAPREQVLVDGERKLIVADSFGGKLAVVDTATCSLATIHDLPAHNIRGLALTPDGRTLLVSQQLLNSLAETTHNDVHWGILLSNILRWLPLQNVLATGGEILHDSHVHSPGDSSNPGGDPAQVAMTSRGTVVWALAGVGEVALGQEYDFGLRRVDVGQRPTAVLLSPDEQTAYVADTFGEAIAVVDVNRDAAARISLGPQPELTQAERGELLFYDARLSLDGWFSCHGCHTDGHSCGLLADTQGDGTFGAAKRVHSLLGTSQTAPWAWNGSEDWLEGQVRKSVGVTMQGRELSPQQVREISHYLHTLDSPPSLAALRGTANSDAIARGRAVFERQGCTNCHIAPAYTSADAYNVGLKDKLGQHEFNPPSLRGVSQGGPYFHDGRAATLEEVFARFEHQLEEPLADSELRDLLHFLRSL
jgi:YVTN family beta-propeller protein